MAENVRGAVTPLDTYSRLETKRKKRAFNLLIPALLGSAALFASRPPGIDAAPPQPKEIGVVSDIAEQANPELASAAISLVRQAGFNVLKETVQIATGQQGFGDMNQNDQNRINNSLDAARAQGMPVILYLWPQAYINGYQAPVRPSQQRGFCRVGAQIIAAHPGVVVGAAIGFEPNNPRSGWKQFNSDGSDAVAYPYESLVAKCYDIIKAQDPGVEIIAGEVAPFGNDNPSAPNASISPIQFMKDFCTAYKESGRTLPVEDEESVHDYLPISSTNMTINGLDDVTKAEDTLRQCFSGTNQPTPKIVIGEGGRTVKVPVTKLARYGGTQPGGPMAMSERGQAQYLTYAYTHVLCDMPPAEELVGYFNFQLIDDGGPLDTGLGFAPGLESSKRKNTSNGLTVDRKASWSAVSRLSQEYSDGTLCAP